MAGHADHDERACLAFGGQSIDVRKQFGLIDGASNMKPVIFPGRTDIDESYLIAFALEQLLQVPGKHGLNPGQIPRKIPADYEEEYKDKDRHIRKKSSNPADLDIKAENKIDRSTLRLSTGRIP